MKVILMIVVLGSHAPIFQFREFQSLATCESAASTLHYLDGEKSGSWRSNILYSCTEDKP